MDKARKYVNVNGERKASLPLGKNTSMSSAVAEKEKEDFQIRWKEGTITAIVELQSGIKGMSTTFSEKEESGESA